MTSFLFLRVNLAQYSVFISDCITYRKPDERFSGHLKHWVISAAMFLCFLCWYLVPESLPVQSEDNHGRVREEALVVE